MSQSRDEIAEQVVALAGSIGNEKAERMRELVAEARRKGAQASGAPAKWRVEVVHGRARLIVDASGDSGEQSFWINDADTDDEPGHAEFHARMLRIAIGRIVGAPAPASAQEFEVENDHATCLWCDAGPFTYDVGPGGWDEHWRTCEKSPRNKRKTSAPASAQSEVCEKCSGAGWVWGHELPTPEEKPTDTRYSCPACRVTNIDGTPPSSEKTGEAHK